jgi:predicted nucleic acid-binding protein
MTGFTLDAGALIAVERGDDRIMRLLKRALDEGLDVRVPVAVVGQVWRGGPKQARLARLLRSVEIEGLTLELMQRVGVRIGECGHPDVIDVTVALCAEDHGQAVVTSDPDDIAAVGPTLEIVTI